MSHINIIATDIQKAASLLKLGKLVAFPTETVYGLGADASNPSAVTKIFAVKKRPADHPVIVHLGHLNQLTHWAQNISSAALKLAKHFWPGPLTLILPKAANVAEIITGGQNTIGIRIPSHPIAQALLKSFGSGIAAPSANRFGQLSPTSATHVQADLGTDIDMVLEGDTCTIGIESTIVDISSGIAHILRPGAITAAQISQVLQQPVYYLDRSSVRAPGMLLKHYAPRTKLEIVPAVLLKQKINTLLTQDLKIAVMARHPANFVHPNLKWHMMPTIASEYAHALYAYLHAIDMENPAIILVEAVPVDEEWMAISDRLQKASA